MPALSSGEAEYNAAIKGAQVLLGCVAFAEDFGFKLRAQLETDSSAALGMLRRSGLGKVRHIATPLLWAQKVVAQGRISISKKAGETNPADLATIFLAGPRIKDLMGRINCYFEKGKAKVGLKAQF